MENNRNQGRKNLKIYAKLDKKRIFLYAFVLGIAISALFLILSFLLPTLISSNYYQKSLTQLRNKAETIKNEFTHVLDNIEQKKQLLLSSPFPEKKDGIFTLFKQIVLNTEREGLAYYKSQEDLILWLGNIVDIKSISYSNEDGILYKEQKSSLLVRYKASVYLISIQKVNRDDYIVLYNLLAFLPQFKTPYLKEISFLKPKLQRNTVIDYLDFHEDVSGFEKIFASYKDEYIGQPRLQDNIQTILFPLRNEKNEIVATVTLSSPSLSSKISVQKENILLILYLLFGASLLSLLIHLLKSPLFFKERKLLPGLLVLLTLGGLRLLFFPLSNLEKIQSLSIFSPASASFLSFWNFTKSPADIFLTSLFLFLIIGCLAVYSRNLFNSEKKESSFVLSFLFSSVFIFISLLLIFLFQEFLIRLVFHSSLNLLRFSFEPSFILIHLSILFFFFTFFLTSLTGIRIASLYSSKLLLPLLILLLEFGVYILVFRERNSFILFFLQASVIILIFIFAYFPKVMRKKEVLFSAFLLIILFIFFSVHYSSSNRNRSLLQDSLQDIIKSQENWGTFLINQSLPEIDKKNESIESFFNISEPADLAHSLWERTLIAKFNWYSSLEMLSPEGIVLSRFSLNVPELYRLDVGLPLSQEWSISHQTIQFMKKEKDFIVGYKDWFEEENHLGRLIICLSVDYDMLPFLYSANPYFELLRVSSIPSLEQLDLGFAIFDSSGKLLFNPDKISSGIPTTLLQKIQTSQDSIWSSFTDKKKKFKSLYFRNKTRIYSLFIPEKNFLNYSVEFLTLFSLYLICFLFFFFLFSILFGTKKIKNPLWSFSNRVYISFVAIALVPLFLFTLSTRNFFARIFTQQFTEKAEAQASVAQRVMEDFIFIQQEEQVSLTLPPDDLVLWISSTISNDVNLYQNGSLISSSRREFFDYGLLPEIINGEVFYKIQYENNPFYTQTQKIGDYSFHTLTIPYSFQDSLLLISLPFPLEQQEISKATEDLIEFLFFISAFFIAVVLLFARGIGEMIITPVKKLLVGTKEVSLGNLEISIPYKHKDEMKTIIDGFNTMVKNLKKHQQELADMTKKVAWAEMARKVAHEIKNPLTPIQLSAEHLLKVYNDKKENFDETLKESVLYIINEVENLRKIAHEFLEISKEVTLQKEDFDLKETIQETIEPYKKVLSERITFLETYDGEDFVFTGDKAKIKIVLRNIFTNAIESVHGQGEIKIKASSKKTGLILEIKDTGIGIEKDALDRIFEPYFSTKDVGTGLGLPIAKKIIEDHGGSINASSKKNEGTQILIRLPKSSDTENNKSKTNLV